MNSEASTIPSTVPMNTSSSSSSSLLPIPPPPPPRPSSRSDSVSSRGSRRSNDSIHRSRSRNDDHHHHHHSSRSRRSTSRERHSSRYDDKDGSSRHRDRHRDRSRSRDRYRDRSRSRDRHRDRSRSRERRRDRSRSRSRDRHHHKERYTMSKEEAEIMDLTRDARTVFVSQLVARTTEKDLKYYFNQVGHVVQVSMIKDKYSGKCKGFAYVEFEDISEVAHALLLNGQRFCTQHRGCVCSGFPIAIKTSQAEKNYAAMAEHAGGSALSEGIEKRVYLCNLPREITEGDIRIVAQGFGNIDKVALLRDRRGHSRGAGYIAFNNMEAASKALEKLHNFTIGNQQIKAGKLNPLGQVVAYTGETFPLHEGNQEGLNLQARVALLAKLSNMTAETIKNIGGAAIMAALTKEQSGSGSNGSSSSSSTVVPTVPPVLVPTLSSTVSSSASASSSSSSSSTTIAPPLTTSCVLLKNMFNPATETEPDWINDITEEVQDELGKFGTIQNIYVHPVSPEGLIYVLYVNDHTNNGVQSVITAMQTLQGKKFGGQIIQLEPVPVEIVQQIFPLR